MGLYRSHDLSVRRVVIALIFLQTSPWPTSLLCRAIMSAADLASMPAATPPPGVTANFDNPPSNAYILITVTTICMVLLYMTMTISLYAKINIRKKMSLDDCETFAFLSSRGSILIPPGTRLIATFGTTIYYIASVIGKASIPLIHDFTSSYRLTYCTM